MLSHAYYLYSPGTLRSGMVDEFIKRKNTGKWKIINEQIEKITEDTFGVIVYQEQVMEMANKIACLPWREVDKIRKVIGHSKSKKELEEKYREKFISGCVDNKILKTKEAVELWRQLIEFGGYGFNKSHAVAYAMMAYCCQWLKKYYPTEFICAVLTHGSEEKKSETIKEAYRLGLSIILPKIGKSDSFNWIIKDNKLYCPFIEVKGIGKKRAVEIMEKKPQLKIKKSISRKGFFSGQKNVIEKRKITQIDKILEEIGANENEDYQIEDKEILKKYFSFDIQGTPENTYPNLFKIFGDNIFSFELIDVLAGKIGFDGMIKNKNFV